MVNASRIDPEARLASLGIVLPVPAKPVAAYIPARRSGNLLYISGQIPMRDGALIATGRVPEAVSLEKARECARQCAINGLAAAKAELGSLAAIRQVVRVGCFVACVDGYGDQPKIANGASEFLVEVFGESGKHARAAVGTNSLPLNIPVEVEFLFEVE
ncbi:MAG TPA: RidA family protein [Phycisphaerales bacterium]|jgi:enamine deaminase RidA (YjgF/YER057c/UK114 family)|nr:RidA family protein [Phycisphaerales bacterium]